MSLTQEEACVVSSTP